MKYKLRLSKRFSVSSIHIICVSVWMDVCVRNKRLYSLQLIGGRFCFFKCNSYFKLERIWLLLCEKVAGGSKVQ